MSRPPGKNILNNDIAIGAAINHNVLTPFFDVFYTHNDFKPYVNNISETNNYTVSEGNIVAALFS